MMLAKLGWSVLVAVVAALVGLQLMPRCTIPEHLLGHHAVEIPELFSPEVGQQLMDLLLEMGEFPSNVADTKSYTTLREHIGEGRPITADGLCAHPYLVPSVDKKLCVLPGRIDIGKHFMMSGGVIGMKHKYADVVSRLQSFGRYMFDLTDYPVIQELFSSHVFQHAAKSVCPASEQVLDPFQFNFILQLPGQAVATHIDGVYFNGASRFQFPQWLLAVMSFSNLFKDDFINQVQVVGYVHQWKDPDNKRDGKFIYWNENDKPKFVEPLPFSGTAVDGSKLVHAAMTYYPGVRPPFIDKSKENILKYTKSIDQWHLESDGVNLANYTTDDLRISIVYRGRCFASEEAQRAFHERTEFMSLESILTRLQDDLVRRGRTLPERRDGLSAEDWTLELAFLLLDEYVQYPLSADAWIPYNYCMLGKLMPMLDGLLTPFCS